MSSRCSYREAVDRLEVLSRLARFDPHLAGTPPLGIDRPDSDIDILCSASDPEHFVETVWTAFSHADGFAIRQWASGDRPIIAGFHAHGWEFELFCSPLPVARQSGWRHYLMEGRLLDLGGPPLRAAVMAHRDAGLKTEPAFAAVLGLDGDPYQALLDLEGQSNEAMLRLIGAAGMSGRS